jgi:putative salt-induced outer membrane protein
MLQNFTGSSIPKLALGLLLTSSMGLAQAQTVQDNQWHGGVAIGGSYASSNTIAQTFNLSANGTKASKEDKLGLYAVMNYGSNTVNKVKTNTAQLARLGGRYDYNLSENSFFFSGSEVETNKIQNIDSRYSVNAGAGFKLIKTDETSFDLFTGLGYSDTRFGTTIPPSPTNKKGVEFLIGEESTHKLSSTSSIKQRWAIYPGSSNIGTRSTFDISLVTVVANGWTMNASAAISYTSKPSNNFNKTSSLITFGFGYKY